MRSFFSRRSSTTHSPAPPQATSSRSDPPGRVFALTPGIVPGSVYESVVVDGRSQGHVMRRSAHVVVWAERGNEVYVYGDDLPARCVARMWEGPRRAAISDDEQWCVVIGLGLIAFPLMAGAEVQSYGRRPYHERWQLHQPVKGDLAGAVLFTAVRYLRAHQFAVSTTWGLGNMWTTREWVYDADTNSLGDPRDTIDEEKRRQAIRPQPSAAYADEKQLAAALRSDGAESAAEAGLTFERNAAGGETVVSKGRPTGTVLCRSQRFVVWQELGSMACVEGDGLPYLLLDDMYGGATAAAISDDEEWCVVVGRGFCVRRLRVGGDFRLHGADPQNIMWLNGVEALDGHTFRLRWDGSSGTEEYIYDADSDALRQE